MRKYLHVLILFFHSNHSSLIVNFFSITWQLTTGYAIHFLRWQFPIVQMFSLRIHWLIRMSHCSPFFRIRKKILFLCLNIGCVCFRLRKSFHSSPAALKHLKLSTVSTLFIGSAIQCGLHASYIILESESETNSHVVMSIVDGRWSFGYSPFGKWLCWS